MSVEIHGWTKRGDGTVWFGVLVVEGTLPLLVADLIGTRWTLEPELGEKP